MQNFTTKYGAEIPIRALSWKQPYLDLMLHGKIETRTWVTNYRGWVMMCASKQAYNLTKLLEISGSEQEKIIWNTLVYENIKDYEKNYFLTGHALAIGRLVDCRPMLPTDEAKTFIQYRAPWIKRDKDGMACWDKNGKVIYKRLYCHIYEDVQAIEPFCWSGSQGWKVLNESEKSLIILP